MSNLGPGGEVRENESEDEPRKERRIWNKMRDRETKTKALEVLRCPD